MNDKKSKSVHLEDKVHDRLKEEAENTGKSIRYIVNDTLKKEFRIYE